MRRQRSFYLTRILILAGALALLCQLGAKAPDPAEPIPRAKPECDRPGRRVLGTFQETGQGPRLAWFDLDSGRLTPVGLSEIRPQRYALSHDGRWIALLTTLDRPGEQGGNNGPEVDVSK